MSVVVKGMGDGKCGSVQAWPSAVLRGLQHVLSGQPRGSLVTQDKRILQKVNNLGFGFEVLGPFPSFKPSGNLSPVSGDHREIVGSGDMPDLHGKGAHILVVASQEFSGSQERN